MVEAARPSPFTVVLHGEVDLSVAQALSQLALDFETGEARDARVDLRTVTFLDSSGLGFLARLLRAAEERAGTVTVIGARSSVMRLLSISGLQALLVIED